MFYYDHLGAGDLKEGRKPGPPRPSATRRPRPRQARSAGAPTRHPRDAPSLGRALTWACSSCPPASRPAAPAGTAACGQPCCLGRPRGLRWCVFPAARVAKRPAELRAAQTRPGRGAAQAPPAATGERATPRRPCATPPTTPPPTPGGVDSGRGSSKNQVLGLILSFFFLICCD